MFESYEKFSDACRDGDLNTVIEFIENKKVDVNNINKYGYSSLILAADNNRFDVVKYLIEKGADVNLKGHAEFSPLSSIVNEKRLNEEGFKIFELLLDQPNIDIESRSQYGSTPLILAVENLKRKDHIQSDDNFNLELRLNVIKNLLDKGANLYAKDYNFKSEPNDDGLDVFDIANKSDYNYVNKYKNQILSILNKYKNI